ncbi:MAG: hypothetical protein IJK66_05760 [Bacilli bacterium]|nr:hypothetical protein [Bacilli bacterium]
MALKSVLLPILLAVVALILIIVIVNVLFRLAQLDIWILKFGAVLMAWYFLGPILLDWLEEILEIDVNEGVKILYMPIQTILEKIHGLV